MVKTKLKAAVRKKMRTKEGKAILRNRLIQWRKQHTVERIDKPTNPSRARSLGYKAKKGIVMARVRVKKGGRRRRLYGRGGRKPKKAGLVRFTPGKTEARGRRCGAMPVSITATEGQFSELFIPTDLLVGR